METNVLTATAHQPRTATPGNDVAASKAADIGTEGEVWAEAYRRDLRQQPPGLLEAACMAAARDGAPEPPGPPWPDLGTPERKRLDERNAELCEALREGFERHRAALLARKKTLIG
jgi:hypothetical protein